MFSPPVVGVSIQGEVPYRKVTMRPCTSDDQGPLFAVAKLAFASCDEERTLAALRRDTVFVAELAGQPAGYVAIEESAGALRIEQLCVHPAHEEEGVGRQLLEWAEGYAISSGAARLEVVVEGDNDRATAFYRGRGFVQTAPDVLELVLPQAQ
jgi:ribosomal protein S18 acetylase RimI-like enzyme